MMRPQRLPVFLVAMVAPLFLAVSSPAQNRYGFAMSVPTSAPRCSTVEMRVTTDSQWPCEGCNLGHEWSTVSASGAALVRGWRERCGYGPGPCPAGLTQSEWHMGYNGPLRYEFVLTGATQAVFGASYIGDTYGRSGEPVSAVPVVVSLTAAAAVTLSVSTAGVTSLPADGTSTTPLYITARDANCQGIRNLALGVATTLGTLKTATAEGAAITVQTDSSGAATVTLIASSTPGTATVNVSASGAAASTTVEMKGAALSVSASPTSLVAGGSAGASITAYYRDGKGAGVAGKPVLLSTTSGTLTSGGTSGTDVALTTDSGGSVSATLRPTAKPGMATITASTESSAGIAPAQTTVGFTTDEATQLGSGQDTPYVSDPVHPGLGNFVYRKRLFELPGRGLPVAFDVTYNSHAIGTYGPLGSGWRHSYHITLAATNDAVTDHLGRRRRHALRHEPDRRLPSGRQPERPATDQARRQHLRGVGGRVAGAPPLRHERKAHSHRRWPRQPGDADPRPRGTHTHH